MSEHKNIQQDPENQEFTQNDGAEGDNGTKACQEEGGDNVSEGSDNPSDNLPLTPEEEAAIWKDKYIRLSAEFDNYRKRTLKEKMDIIASGGEDVIKSLLPVMDDIDRALDAMGKTEDIDSVRTGVELIAGKLRDTMISRGVREIEAVGQELDTDLHEAIAKIPADKKQRGKIVDVVQKGYTLKDKVIRHSKVVVGE